MECRYLQPRPEGADYRTGPVDNLRDRRTRERQEQCLLRGGQPGALPGHHRFPANRQQPPIHGFKVGPCCSHRCRGLSRTCAAQDNQHRSSAGDDVDLLALRFIGHKVPIDSLGMSGRSINAGPLYLGLAATATEVSAATIIGG